MFIRTSTLKIVAKPNRPVLLNTRTIAANELNIEHVRQYQRDIKRYYRATLRG
jgi:hypothetical protein